MSVAEMEVEELENVEAVESEDSQAVAGEVQEEQPLSHYERLYLERIQEMEHDCAEKETVYKAAQSEAKDAKLSWEGHIAAMRSFISRGPKGLMQQNLPLVDGDQQELPLEDDSWKSVPIDAILDLTEKQKEKLESAGINTAMDFERVRAGNEEYPRGLHSIKGVGQATADKWENEMLDWLVKNQQQPATESTE